MTPKERIKAAMDLKPVDKVPLMCQLSIGHMLVQLGISPLEFWLDMNTYSKGLIELRDQYDFDGILISLYGHDPDWKDKILKREITEKFEIATFISGDKLFCPFDDLPYYILADEQKRLSLNEIQKNNLPDILDYFPVSQKLPFYINSNHKFDIIKKMVADKGDQYSIHGEITSPFDYYLDLVGHQEGLMGILFSPGNAKIILEHYTNLIIELTNEMCKTGVDAIKISSPFAGSNFISPVHYKEFVYPYEKKIIETIRNNNIHVYLHTCGAISDRLEIMFETGATGIECLDPPPLGNVELSDAFNRIEGKGFIKGNIDSVNTLLNGSNDEIIADVKKRIEIGSKRYGFILSTACSIAPNVKKENIQIIRKTIDEEYS